jgi:hypothetical protein
MQLPAVNVDLDTCLQRGAPDDPNITPRAHDGFRSLLSIPDDAKVTLQDAIRPVAMGTYIPLWPQRGAAHHKTRRLRPLRLYSYARFRYSNGGARTTNHRAPFPSGTPGQKTKEAFRGRREIRDFLGQNAQYWCFIATE